MRNGPSHRRLPRDDRGRREGEGNAQDTREAFLLFCLMQCARHLPARSHFNGIPGGALGGGRGFARGSQISETRGSPDKSSLLPPGIPFPITRAATASSKIGEAKRKPQNLNAGVNQLTAAGTFGAPYDDMANENEVVPVLILASHQCCYINFTLQQLYFTAQYRFNADVPDHGPFISGVCYALANES